jgi:Na+-transporting NADH:ubiquinone oxidoreductase subunit NqrD
MFHTTTDRPPVRSPYGWVALSIVGAALGTGLSLSSEQLPGAEPRTLEDFVDVVCLLLFGVLGAELVRRSIATGLGRALMLLGGLEAVNCVLAGASDALADGRTPPSALSQLCSMGAEVAFIGTFFLLIYAPLALFPTGRLPSRRWRWLSWCAAAGVGSMSLSILLAPGPLDDDNPAAGANPLGVDALGGVTDALELAAAALLALTLAGGVAAFVVRWVRYRGIRRRQLAWFTAGATTMVIGMVTEFGGSVAVEVATALAIFGTLLVGIGWPLLGPLGRAVSTEPHAGAEATKVA